MLTNKIFMAFNIKLFGIIITKTVVSIIDIHVVFYFFIQSFISINFRMELYM